MKEVDAYIVSGACDGAGTGDVLDCESGDGDTGCGSSLERAVSLIFTQDLFWGG